jgi:hypothetical protein
MRFLNAVIGFAMFFAIGLILTSMTYFCVFGLSTFVCHSAGILQRFPHAPLLITGFFFAASVFAAIRRQLPNITTLKWDSGTTQPSPSRVSLPGAGGRLWNVNPLGPNSIASIHSVLVACLVIGPCFMVIAFTTFIECLYQKA